MSEERFDLVDEFCKPLGVTKARKLVHRDGDWHQAVHVWVLFHDTWEVVMQQRNLDKDSWPGMWDISSAGHVVAGDGILESAVRELQEELGLDLPEDAFRFLFRYKQEFQGEFHGKKFVNNEFNHVYCVTLKSRLPVSAFTLQSSEVRAVKFVKLVELGDLLRRGDPDHCVYLAGLGAQGGPLEAAKYADLFKLERVDHGHDRWGKIRVNGVQVEYLTQASK